MKPLAIALFATATLAAAPLWADDVRPDHVLDLVEQGTIQDLRELNRAALELHPGATIRSSELEEERGRYVYELELRSGDGEEWDVKFDAGNGEVLKNKRDH